MTPALELAVHPPIRQLSEGRALIPFNPSVWSSDERAEQVRDQ